MTSITHLHLFDRGFDHFLSFKKVLTVRDAPSFSTETAASPVSAFDDKG